MKVTPVLNFLNNFVLMSHRIRYLMIGLGLCIILTAISVPFFSAGATGATFLTTEEKAWLEENSDKLVLWFNTDFPPIKFVSDYKTVRLFVTFTIFLVLLVLGLIVISYFLRQHLKEKIADLNAARQKISEQAQFLNLVADAAQAGIWDLYMAENEGIISSQWFAMLGYKRNTERVPMNKFLEFVHPDDLSVLEEKNRTYVKNKGKGLIEVEIRLLQANGDYCWVLVKGSAVQWDEGGTPLRIIGLTINIQTIRDAQEEMRQSEAKFRTIFDNAPYAIVINDLESLKVVDANPALLNTYGMKSREELVQIPNIGFSTISKDEAQRFVDRLLETGKINKYEVQAVRGDGHRHHLLFSSALMECAGRKQIISMILDNTEQKEAEEALRLSEERFRRLFMSAPVPLVLLSPDGTISNLNDAMVHTFGYTLEDIPDLDHWWYLAYPDPDYRHRAKFTWENDVQRALTDNVPVKAHEYHVTCKNGKVLRVRFNTNVFSEMVIVSLYEITDLIEKEAALQETMEQLRATLNATNNGILVVNRDLKVIQANRQFYEMWHIPIDLQNIDDDVMLRGFVKDQLEDPDGFMHYIDELYDSQRHEMLEIRFNDGRVFEIYSAPMVIAGEETGRVWDFRDITEQKKAEDAIDFERMKLRSIFGAMDDVVLICDARGRVVEVAPTKTALMYRPPDDILGKTLGEIFPPEKADVFMDAIGRAISCNESVILDYELTISDRPFWFAATISPMPPDRVVWVARDITERKQAETQLRQSEEKFSKVFAMAPSIVAITRFEDANIIDVNDGFEEITGWKKSEAIGRTAADIRFWAEPTRREEHVKELEAGRDLLNREVYFRRKDGSLRNGLYSARTIHISGELSIVSVVQDITEIKQIEADRENLQKQLSQAQKMEAIGVLAGGIAHDFNNILSAVMGFTDLAIMEAGDNDVMKKYLNSVSSASLRARDLVRHILTFSRKSDVKMQMLFIDPIIKETLKFIRASLPAGIQIHQDLRVKNAQVLGDATQIHQILMNLFTNAGHAMKDKGGRLEVILDTIMIDQTDTSHFDNIKPGCYFSLIVADTGYGISSAIIDRIFEPFFTTKKREEGTGMGLSTVYGILKDMNGVISVYSEVGVGTTFKLLIPEYQQFGQLEKAVDVDLKEGEGNILIIDDEELIVESNQAILSGLGYSVTGTTSSREALEKIEKGPDHFDLVLTDMTMPDMDGIELSRRIKSINPDIPIVLCTGFSHSLTKEMCRSAGVSDLVMKPMIAGELSRAVHNALKKKPGKEANDSCVDH